MTEKDLITPAEALAELEQVTSEQPTVFGFTMRECAQAGAATLRQEIAATTSPLTFSGSLRGGFAAETWARISPSGHVEMFNEEAMRADPSLFAKVCTAIVDHIRGNALAVPANSREFAKGDTNAVCDCGNFEAGIHHNTSAFTTWGQRIVVYGETARDAEALRDRVLLALNAAIPVQQKEASNG